MENGGNNNNVWWDLAHLGLLGEEEMKGTSRPYDYCTSNVVLMNSHDQHHDHDPPRPITISNGGGGGGGGGVAKKVKQYLSSSLYSAGSSHVYPDPHLTCLKLGNPNHNNKRRQYYFEDGTGNIISSTTTTTTTTTAPLGKKGKCYTTGGDGVPLLSVGFGGVSSSSTVVIPRCQVDGCHVELLCAREYHRRHKVCEVHSKATKVEVLGIQQRFCQQCSRFHVITEFDDSKRSCRRRLAGHNERRRKISNSNSNNNNNNNSSSSSNDSSSITTTITSTTRKCFDQGGAVGLPQTNFPSSRQRVSNALSLLSTPGVSPATGDRPHPYCCCTSRSDC